MPDPRANSERPSPVVLFTAFEPSGDDHASAVIAELKRRRPGLAIYAWGGPKMQAAGATLVERTGDDAIMGVPGWEKIREHRRINARVAHWLDENRVDLHVPVDSPAANFPICALAKDRGIRVVHLVAPQIWAWARWRIHKLRRRTDLVLCLLPFEERFFQRRGVPARFIGHFLFDHPLDLATIDLRVSALPAGSPKLAIMPGSRPAEFASNFPLMLETFAALRKERPTLEAVVACTRPEVEALLREQAKALGPAVANNRGWPAGIRGVVGDTDAVVRWCDAALVKSGTVTMQVTKQKRPMVIMYKKKNPLVYLVFKLVQSTKHFTLPNIIAGHEIVPEFVPHYGGSAPITAAVRDLLNSPAPGEQQAADLAAIVDQFKGKNARSLAADAIEEMLGLRPRATPE